MKIDRKKKKPAQKAAPRVQSGVMAVIPYSEISKPETHKGKYSLVPTILNEVQIKSIIAPTPKHIIKTRPGKGGGQWDYVPGWWFKKKLNFVFGFMHDFEILGERVDGDFITVKGKLTIRHPKGGIIASKTDFGGAAIKYKKGTKDYLDLPNDFKAAATDALKRCAVQLGFAMDVYGKGESIENGQNVVDKGPQSSGGSEVVNSVPKGAVNGNGEGQGAHGSATCQGDCGTIVENDAVIKFSKQRYGKVYCRDCQAKVKK